MNVIEACGVHRVQECVNVYDGLGLGLADGDSVSMSTVPWASSALDVIMSTLLL